MARKIFRNTFIVTLLSILSASLLIVFLMYNVLDNRLQTELANTTQLITHLLEDNGGEKDYLKSLDLDGLRITWVATDGSVIYDSSADASTMENHGKRPEIIQAQQIGIGKSSRFSNTLAEKMLYYAMRQKDGSVIRLAATQQSILGIVYGLLPAIAGISVVVMILSAIMARRLVNRAIKPINDLDLEHPAENDVYEELSPLLNRLYQQNLSIEKQKGELAKRQEELTVITDHMSEGLVMLSSDRHIISINLRARKLFSVTEDACIGKHIRTLCRDRSLETVVERASVGENAETLMEIGRRTYQLLASPVFIDLHQVGTVLLILDITERADAERMRREFSANVSHELKTPLTSISGYAEIMKNGVAKQEDMMQFASRIYDESTRMITLIDDIIKLSKLDEGNIDVQKESIDLLALSNEVAHRLAPLCEQYGVTINVHGEEMIVNGVRTILDEMIYNLCENSVKYNKKGGSVDVVIDREEGNPRLIVRDTGIGIPPALQEKVFERFYRVDKSHSRERGGTGLGLSIVKHGARFHDARLLLTSAVGKGTEVKLVFPMKSAR